MLQLASYAWLRNQAWDVKTTELVDPRRWMAGVLIGVALSRGDAGA